MGDQAPTAHLGAKGHIGARGRHSAESPGHTGLDPESIDTILPI